MNKKLDKESQEAQSIESLTVYKTMEKILMAKAKQVSQETDPKTLDNLRFYRDLDAKLHARASLSSAQVHALNSLFTQFANHALATNLHEIKGVLHLAYYSLLSISRLLLAPTNDLQKLATALSQSVATLVTHALRALRQLWDAETNPHGYAKVERVLVRLFQALTSPTSFGNALLLFRGRPAEKKYTFGTGKFKFEKEVGLVLKVQQEMKSDPVRPASLDALLQDFASGHDSLTPSFYEMVSGPPESELSPLAVQAAFDELCISKTAKQLIAKARVHVSFFAYFRSRLGRSKEEVGLFKRLKLGPLSLFLSYIEQRVANDEAARKSLGGPADEFMTYFMEEFAPFALQRAFAEQSMFVKQRVSREVLEIADLASEKEKWTRHLLEEVLTKHFAKSPSQETRKQWVVVSSNVLVHTLKLLRALSHIRLKAGHVLAIAEALGALLGQQRAAASGDQPKRKQLESIGGERKITWTGGRQEPKSAIPAVGSFGPKIEEVKESSSSSEDQHQALAPSSEQEVMNLVLNLSSLVLSFLKSSRGRLQQPSVDEFRLIAAAFYKLQSGLLSSSNLLESQGTVRGQAYGALAEVCESLGQPQKIEELLVEALGENVLFVTFKLVQMAKRTQKYKFPKLFEKLQTLLCSFFENQPPNDPVQFFGRHASLLLSVLLILRELPRQLVLPQAKQIVAEMGAEVEKTPVDQQVAKWGLLLQLVFAFEQAMLEDPEDFAILNPFFDNILKTALSQPVASDLLKLLQIHTPLVPPRKRHLKFLGLLPFPHYQTLAQSASRTTPRIDPLMNEYVKLYQGLLSFREEVDPFASRMVKTSDLAPKELITRIQQLLALPLPELLASNTLTDLEVITAKLVIAEPVPHDMLVGPLAKKIEELREHGDQRLRAAVQECETAPEKASRAQNFFLSSAPGAGKEQKVPEHLMSHKYLGSVVGDLCHELAHDLKARIEKIYDLLAQDVFAKPDKIKERQLLLVALVKRSYIGRNESLSREVALMQTLCLLAFPPKMTPLADFLISPSHEALVVAYFKASNSRTFAFLQLFQFSMHQWLKGISAVQKTLEPYGVISAGVQVSELFNQVKEVLLQSEQSSALLSEWDPVFKNSMRSLEQDILPSKELARALAPAPDTPALVALIFKALRAPQSLCFAQLLDLLLIYPPTLAKPVAAPAPSTDSVTIEKKGNKSVAMSFQFAKPKSESIPASHKPMQSKFIAHLKAKEKRPVKTRETLLSVFQRYTELAVSSEKSLLEQLKERICGLDIAQLKQLIFILSARDAHRFLPFIQQLFTPDSMQKDDPFALTLLGSLANIVLLAFQEQDLREEAAGAEPENPAHFDVDESAFDEKKIKAMIIVKLPEILEAVSHLSAAASKTNPQLTELASSLVEAITASNSPLASKAAMRLIVKSPYFLQALTATRAAPTAPEPSPAAAESESESIDHGAHPLGDLFDKGFGFSRNEANKGERSGPLEGLGQKQVDRQQPPKPGDTCTYSKTSRDYQEQHWYHCITCGLTGNTGCCSKCVLHCHKGHQVIYSRKSNFFCDCPDHGACLYMPKRDGGGGGGGQPSFPNEPDASALFQYSGFQPRAFERGELRSLFRDRQRKAMPQPMGEHQVLLRGSKRGASIREARAFSSGSDGPLSSSEGDSLFNYFERIPPPEDEKTDEKKEGELISPPLSLQAPHSKSAIVETPPSPFLEVLLDQCKDEAVTMSIEALLVSSLEEARAQESPDMEAPQLEEARSEIEGPGIEVLRRKPAVQLGELKVKSRKHIQAPDKLQFQLEQSNPSKSKAVRVMRNRPEFRSQISASGAIFALAEAERISFLKQSCVEAMSERGSQTLDSSNLKVALGYAVGWPVVGVRVNPQNPLFVLVYGMQRCVVLVLSQSFEGLEVAQEIDVELELEAFGDELNLIAIDWLPDSQTHIFCATPLFMKVFDLSRHTQQPTHYLTLAQGNFASVCAVKSGQNIRLLAGSEDGFLFSIEITLLSSSDPLSDNQLIIVESMAFDNFNPPIGLPLIVIRALSSGLVAASWEGGQNVLGLLEKGSISHVVGVQPPAPPELKPPPTLLNKGPIMSNLTQVGDGLYAALWALTDENTGALLYIKLANEAIQIEWQAGLPEDLGTDGFKATGITALQGESRVAVTYEHGIVGVYGLSTGGEKKKEASSNQKIAPVIERSQLPEQVSLPPTTLERMLSLKDIKSQNVVLAGQISRKWHNNKQAVEQLDSFGNTNSLQSNNREVKIEVSVTGGFLLSGMRLALRVGQPYVLKFLNRQVPIKPDRRFYDLPLTDAEIYFIVQTGVQKLELVFQATEEGRSDLQLSQMNIFALRKNDFKLLEKQHQVRSFLVANQVPKITIKKEPKVKPQQQPQERDAFILYDTLIQEMQKTTFSQPLLTVSLLLPAYLMAKQAAPGQNEQVYRSALALASSGRKFNSEAESLLAHQFLSAALKLEAPAQGSLLKNYCQMLQFFKERAPLSLANLKKIRAIAQSFPADYVILLGEFTPMLLERLQHIAQFSVDPPASKATPLSPTHLSELIVLILELVNFQLNAALLRWSPEGLTAEALMDTYKRILNSGFAETPQIFALLQTGATLLLAQNIKNKEPVVRRVLRELHSRSTLFNGLFNQDSSLSDSLKPTEFSTDPFESGSLDFMALKPKSIPYVPFNLTPLLLDALSSAYAPLRPDFVQLSQILHFIYLLLKTEEAVSFPQLSQIADYAIKPVVRLVEGVLSAAPDPTVANPENEAVYFVIQFLLMLTTRIDKKRIAEKKMSRRGLSFKASETTRPLSPGLGPFLSFILASQLVHQCQLANWVEAVLSKLYPWFQSGRATLRAMEQDNVPTGVEASKQRVSRLLHPDIKKGNWHWLLVNHERGLSTSQSHRLDGEAIARDLEIRDQMLAQQSVAILKNMLVLQRAMQKARSKTPLPMEPVLQFLLENYHNVERNPALEAILAKWATHTPCDKVLQKAATGLLNALHKQTSAELVLKSTFQLKLQHFQHLSALSAHFAKPFSYQQLLFQVATIQDLWRQVVDNPGLWRSFLAQTKDPLQILQSLMLQTRQSAPGDQAIEQLLALVAISLEQKGPLLVDPKDSLYRGIERTNEPLTKYVKYLFRHFSRGGEREEHILTAELPQQILEEWARLVLGKYLTGGDKKMRIVASHVLKGIIESLAPSARPAVLQLILNKFKSAAEEGSNSAELMGLLAWACLGSETTLGVEVIKLLMKHVHSVSRAVDAHPNFPIYAALHKILGAEAFQAEGGKQDFLYLLENEPCLRCYEELRAPFEMHTVNNVKSDVKFTDSAHVIQFKEPLAIKSITVDLSSQRGSVALKTLVVYTNNKIGADLTQLKTNRGLWTRKRSVEVSESDSSAKIHFPVAVSAANLMLEFQGATKKVGGHALCMRCGRQVEDRHGVCLNCGENAYQCPYCRNINYQNPTAFLCNECGLSRYTKFEISFYAKPGTALETIETEEQKKAMEIKAAQLSGKMRIEHNTLSHKRSILESLVGELEQSNLQLHSAKPSKRRAGGNVASQIGALYMGECKTAYQKYMTHWTGVMALREEIFQFENRDAQASASSKSRCFGCNMNFLFVSLCFLRQLALSPALAETMLEAAIVQLLHAQSMRSFSQDHRKLATSALCRMVARHQETALQLTKTLREQFALLGTRFHAPALLAQYLQDDVQLLLKLLGVAEEQLLNSESETAQELFDKLMELFWELMEKAVDLSEINGAVAERILTPLLDYLLHSLEREEMLRHAYAALKPAPAKRLQPSGPPPNAFAGLFGNLDEKPSPEQMIAELQAPPEFQQLAERSPEAAEEVARQAAGEVQEWCEFIKAQTASLALPAPEWLGPAPIIKLSSVKPESWLVKCLLLRTSAQVRKLAKGILLCQTANDNVLGQGFMSALASQLEVAVLAQEASAEYFDCMQVFAGQCEKASAGRYKDMVGLLLGTVEHELARLLETTAGVEQSVHLGYGLRRMTEITEGLVEYISVEGLASTLIKSHLKVKKLGARVKNASVGQCEKCLEKMLTRLRASGSQSFVMECIGILDGEIDSAESMFLMEEVRKLVEPEKADPHYLLNLHKAPTQDVYIRGKMAKNPYQSSYFPPADAKEPLMRHVRDKICHELEIGADLMELLVDNKIIELDIPVRLVYEKAWWPALCRKKNPDLLRVPPIGDAKTSELLPMAVIYRLTGLDGEATEDRIESLPDDDADLDADPEKKYALARVLAIGREQGSSGMAILLNRVAKIQKHMAAKERYYAEALMKIFELSCRLKANRLCVIRLGGTQILVKKLIEMLPKSEGGGGSPTKGNLPSLQVISDLLLLTLEELLVEQSEASTVQIGAEGEQEGDAVAILTEKLGQFCKPRRTALDTRYMQAITRILPYVTFGDPTAIQELLTPFVKHLEFTALDLPVSSDPELTEKQFYTERFIELVQAIPEHYEVFKEVMVRRLGVLDTIDAYFNKALLKAPGGKLKKLNDAALQPLAQSLTAALKTLLGLCKCSPLFQASLYRLGHISHIYQLSLAKLSTQRELGVWAERVIVLLSTKPKELKAPKKSLEAGPDMLAAAEAAMRGDLLLSSQPGAVVDLETYEYVNSLIEETKLKRKQKAEEKKRKALQKLGGGGPEKSVTQLFGMGEEPVVEESGLKCIICHEGYESMNQSKNPLGIYIYMEPLDVKAQEDYLTEGAGGQNLLESLITGGKDVLGAGSSLDKGITTVSYFNCIHYHCHRAAYDAEKKLSQPKKEWEGARIRNSHTKCNSLLPVWGVPVPPEDYRKLLDKCFSQIGSHIGNTEVIGTGVALYRARFKMLVHDLRCLVLRFALEESFSFHSKGGGPEHNLKYLPFLMQAAYFTYSQLVNEAASATGQVPENEFKGLMGNLLSAADRGFEPSVDEESKEEGAARKALKAVNLVNSGFYLVISLLFSSLDEWKVEKRAWLKVAVAQARNHSFLVKLDTLTGVKGPVKLRDLECEEGGSSPLLKCLRPGLMAIALVDVMKHKFEEAMDGVPKLTGEYQNKMKDLLREHNPSVLKLTEQLPKDYKELTDFSRLQHFLKKMSLDPLPETEEELLRLLQL